MVAMETVVRLIKYWCFSYGMLCRYKLHSLLTSLFRLYLCVCFFQNFSCILKQYFNVMCSYLC